MRPTVGWCVRRARAVLAFADFLQDLHRDIRQDCPRLAARLDTAFPLP